MNELDWVVWVGEGRGHSEVLVLLFHVLEVLIAVKDKMVVSGPGSGRCEVP